MWARFAATMAVVALVAACGSSLPVQPVSTTESVAPGPQEQLSIGPAATDTFGGWIPEGQTLSPFDTSNPALAQLDPALLQAIQDATRKAASEGIDVRITSGWRTKGFQQRLFDDAVETYGSIDVARQFVAAPDVSKHVLGQAVDVASADADRWLIRTASGLASVRSTRTRFGISSWRSTSTATARR